MPNDSRNAIPETRVNPSDLPSRRPKAAVVEKPGSRVNLGELVEQFDEVYNLVNNADKELEALMAEHAARLKAIKDEHDKQRLRNIERLRAAGRRLYIAMEKSGYERAWHGGRVYERIPGDQEIEVVQGCPEAATISVEITE